MTDCTRDHKALEKIIEEFEQLAVKHAELGQRLQALHDTPQEMRECISLGNQKLPLAEKIASLNCSYQIAKAYATARTFTQPFP